MTQLETLLDKVEFQAEMQREKQLEQRQDAYVQYKSKPKSAAERKRDKLFELRRRNNEIHCEMETDRQLALEAKRNEEANLALYRSRMTPEQKRQQEENTAKMATWASGIYKEALLSWREDAQAECNRKKL
jgi:hypothetical protein